MFVATVVFSGRDWLLPAIVLAVGGIALLAWSYRQAHVSGPVRATCVALKLLGLLALAACLLEPLWSGQRAKPGANFLAVLADNSQGMQIKDRGATQSRGEAMRALLLDAKSTWPTKLDEHFQLRRYQFDTRVQGTRDFSELAFDGRATALHAALRNLAERYQGQPLGGVLIFTDGNATDWPEGGPNLAGLPPIYPVVLGTDDPIKDLAVQKTSVSQTSFEDAPVTIQAEAMVTGYSGSSIVAQLLEVGRGSNPTVVKTNVPTAAPTNTFKLTATGEKIVAEQTQRATRDVDTLAFRFQTRPERGGLTFYQLRIATRDELGAFTDATVSTEATLANNRRTIVVDRGQGPYRVLYVSGRPNWEFKFLNRALAEDDQVELVGLIRVAKREPKFQFKGRAGEASNPLFRGFDKKSEETERYDQPVLIRLNTKDQVELSGGFPKTAEELFAYHAIVLDDLEADFFTHDQMALLQRFVSQRGGGFLMLGGQESFHEGKFDRTPIGDLLPVYLDRTPEGRVPRDLRLAFTREGWLQPWARLRSNEAEERTRLDTMPPFQVLNYVRDIKPGATVVANVTDARNEKYPAVVVQRFGHGRAGAVLVGDLWRWGMGDENRQRDLAKSWRQLLRWLVADVPNRIAVQAEPKPGDANQAVEVQTRARDKKFQPLDNARVTMTVQSLGTTSASPTRSGSGEVSSEKPRATNAATVQLSADASATEAGLYGSTYVPRDTGGYLVQAVVTDAEGVEVGRAEAGWASDPAAEEFRSLKPNRALLENLARQTGGEVIPISRLDAFAESLPRRKVPITESWTSPLWHQAGVFLFALACFVAEWGVRRMKGLA